MSRVRSRQVTQALAAGGTQVRAALILLLIHVCVVVVAYAPVTLGGRSLVPALYVPGGRTDPGRPGGRLPDGGFNVDLATPAFYEWPINRMVGNSLASGELPFWNPYQGAGTPLIAQYSSRVFFPYQMIENVSPPVMGDVFLLGRPCLAGFMTSLVLMGLGLPLGAAAFGGIAYSLGGSFSWFLHLEQMANVALAQPLLLLALQRLHAARTIRAAAIVAAAVALILFAGQPEVALYALTFGGLFWLYLSPSVVSLGWPVGAFLTGGILALPLLLPFVELMGQAHHLHPLGGDMGVRDPTPFGWLGALFMPSLLEYPNAHSYFPQNGQWDYLGGFTGITPWLVIGWGLWFGPPRTFRPIVLFASITSTLLLKNAGIPPFAWIGHLPIFDMAWSQRWAGPVWSLSLALSAGFAAAAVAEPGGGGEGDTAPLRSRARRVAAVIGVLIFAAFALTTRDALTYAFVGHLVLGMVGCGLALVCFGLVAGRPMEPRLRLVALSAILLGEMMFAIPHPRPHGFLDLLPFAAACAGAVAILLGARVVTYVSFVAVPVAALLVDVNSLQGEPDRADPYQAPPFIDFLRSQPGPFRIMGFDRILYPNQASVFGIEDIRYVDALAPAGYHRFVTELLREPPTEYYDSLWFTGVKPGGDALAVDYVRHARFYALAGVRYLLTPAQVDPARAPDLPLVYSGEVRIYEDPEALPRAFIVSDVEEVTTIEDALQVMKAEAFDPGRNAVVEGSLPFRLDPAATGTVRITGRSAEHLALRVHTTGPALLLVTDTWYPGWTATLDGVQTTLLRADAAFRGVPLPAGEHEVAFVYQTHRFTWAFLGWGPVVMAVALGGRRRRRRDTSLAPDQRRHVVGHASRAPTNGPPGAEPEAAPPTVGQPPVTGGPPPPPTPARSSS